MFDLLGVALAEFRLASSRKAMQKGDYALARTKLSKVLDKNYEDFEFVLAFDATLMIFEKRNFESQKRFLECLVEHSSSTEDDDRYVCLYCKFYLEPKDNSEQLSAIRKEALSLNADWRRKNYLPFPSEETIKRLIAEGRDKQETVSENGNAPFCASSGSVEI